MLGLSHELRDRDRQRYDAFIRYLLAASVAGGWGWGYLEDFTVETYGLWFAFIAGCIVATGTVSDLPRISSTKALPAFTPGAAGYTTLLLIVEQLSQSAV